MATTESTTAAAHRPGGGRFSTTFDQPVGSQVVPDDVRGYYIDFRVKARVPRWPAPELDPLDRQLHVDLAQWGLGAFEHYLAEGRKEWLEAALGLGQHLVRTQHRGGRKDGGWIHPEPYPHTFRLKPPWLSAMAQGEGASLLLRLGRETGDQRLLEAAVAALRPLEVHVREGGVLVDLHGGRFVEEYPTETPSYVLNGGIFALWGHYDAAVALSDAGQRELFEECVDTVASNIELWDTGYWTRYDLFPHPLPNIASSAYHTLHINQLEALTRLAPRAELDAAVERFRGYDRSRVRRLRATAAKVAFRLAVPRSHDLADRLPWAAAR